MLAEQIPLKQSQGLRMPFQRLWATMVTFLILQIVLDRVLKRPVEGFSTRVVVTPEVIQNVACLRLGQHHHLQVEEDKWSLSLLPLVETETHLLPLAVGKGQRETERVP